MRTVVLYERPGCCLCEEALEVLHRVRRRHPFALVQRDIELDDRLLGRYLERIPVVCIDGREVFELFVSELELERALTDPEPPGPPCRVSRG